MSKAIFNKKVLAAAIAGLMSVSLVGCGGSTGGPVSYTHLGIWLTVIYWADHRPCGTWRIYRKLMQTEMDRVDRIIYNEEYRRRMETVRNKETDRICCRHGLEHCLDVARIAYIMNIEQGYAIDREIIYAAARLHDVGRADPDDTGRKHHELSVE